AEVRRIGVEVVLPTHELLLARVKVTLRPKGAEAAQMALFAELGRTLVLDVARAGGGGKKASVLAGKPREVRIEAKDKEQTVNLNFNSSESFRQGELLELDIRDTETGEQFPPGGIKLTVGRDM